MIKKFLSPARKINIILIVVLTTVVFFLGYNTYLVDYSLVNLRTSLIKLQSTDNLDDAKKLIPLLDDSLLEEIASRELKVDDLSYTELAKYVLDKSEDKAQLDDVEFALKKALEHKEKGKSPAVAILDKIFTPLAKMPSKPQLEDKVKMLKRRLNTARAKGIRQSIYYDLASTYVKLGNLDSAKEAYRQVLSLDPGAKLAERAKLNLAWSEKFQGNLDEALVQFEDISLTTKQENLILFSKYQTAEVYKLKGDYEKAIALYKEIQEKYPDSELNKLSGFQICYLYLHELKKYDEAEDAFEKINDVCAGSDLSIRVAKTKLLNIAHRYNQMGFNLLRDGYLMHSSVKYREALVYFDKALTVSFQDGIARTGQALAHLWLDELDGALQYAREASKSAHHHEFITVNLCYVYLQLGLINDALAICKRFIANNPKAFRVYYNLGFVYIIQNKPEEGGRAFYRVTKIEPRFAAAYNNLGYCLWHLKKFAKAINSFEETIEIEPKVLEGHFNLGLAYAEIGRYEEAQRKFTDVLEANPQHFEAQVCLREVERVLKESGGIGAGGL